MTTDRGADRDADSWALLNYKITHSSLAELKIQGQIMDKEDMVLVFIGHS